MMAKMIIKIKWINLNILLRLVQKLKGHLRQSRVLGWHRRGEEEIVNETDGFRLPAATKEVF